MKINIKLTSNYFNHKGFNYISPLDNYRGQKRSSSMFLSVAGVYVGGGGREYRYWWGYRSQWGWGEVRNFALQLLFVHLLIFSNMITVTKADKGKEDYVEGVVKRSRKGGSVGGRKDHRIIIGSH